MNGTSDAEIGERLRQAREAKEMTQLDVSRRLCVSRALISQYEIGDTTVSLDYLRRLSKILDVPLAELIGLSGSSIDNLPPTIQDAIQVMLGLSPEDRTVILRVVKAFAGQGQE